MADCLFASDLHGKTHRYERLFASMEAERPAGVFLGGDLLPFPIGSGPPDFFRSVLLPGNLI